MQKAKKMRRGRPKGSKNRVKHIKQVRRVRRVKRMNRIKKIKKIKQIKHGKRGRPKGSKNKIKIKTDTTTTTTTSYKVKAYRTKVEIYPYVVAYKFLGYCRCNTMISKKDLAGKFIYVCPVCGKRGRIKVLKANLANLNIDSPDRKEDKETEVHAHIDTLPLNEHVIDIKDFKVRE